LRCVAAHLRFHLLKQGVTEDSALKLICSSCTAQELHNAINATMKDGKVILLVQAKLEDNIEDMMKRACWVDIIKKMEMSERVEYKHEARGQAHLLYPSNPEALNFLDEQSMKSLNTHISGGTHYTAAFSSSQGNTAYMPGNKEVDSQKSDLFEQFDNSSEDDVLDGVADRDIIANLHYVAGLAFTRKATPNNNANVNNGFYDSKK
jgi:hypothetical protein